MNELLLSKDIYNISAIKQTISAFSELAKISLYNNASHYVCVFENCIYAQDETIKEFENYLIDLCNRLE